jgi:hypothetical protein
MFLYIPEKTALYHLSKPQAYLGLQDYLFQLLAEMCRYELWNHAMGALKAQSFAGQEYHSAQSTQTI